MSGSTMKDEYAVWVCMDCGERACKINVSQQILTFHLGKCGVCGEEKAVTEPRGYGYPNFAIIGDTDE